MSFTERRRRLRDASLAALAGWLAGFGMTIPFEFDLAERYVNGHEHLLAQTLVQGLVVWACFTLFMAVVAWVPLVLPVALLLSPRWIVRWRWIFIPGSFAAAFLAMGWRLHLFIKENFVDLSTVRGNFLTAPNIFAWTFALVLSIVYVRLAARRLPSGARTL